MAPQSFETSPQAPCAGDSRRSRNNSVSDFQARCVDPSVRSGPGEGGGRQHREGPRGDSCVLLPGQQR